MNPLFIAHLIGDFLLQPKWLVDLKEKRPAGIVLHASIHAATMFALVVPQNSKAIIAILLIAVAHGIIDYLKIFFNKRVTVYSVPFLTDQIMHSVVMMCAAYFVNFSGIFWQTQSGLLVLFILSFFSFAVAWLNLSGGANKKLTALTALQKFSLVAISFLLFLIPSRLF
ncbi:MAG: DUF3307 domain-containing protein [Candidatus Gracilibacteria bacterium]|jgi:hypothetical protein